jgi:hypothetical protein
VVIDNFGSRAERSDVTNTRIAMRYKIWIPVNWGTLGLKYFDPVKLLPKIYEVAHKGLKRYMFVRRNITFPFIE